MRRRRDNTVWDERQPDCDPVALMHGLETRREDRLRHLSDEELDRISGNRARGPDPNVMTMPDFSLLRAEREHGSLLQATLDTQADDGDDSLSMRFAMAAFQRGSGRHVHQGQRDHRGRPRRRHR
jgi:hypothetical protein